MAGRAGGRDPEGVAAGRASVTGQWWHGEMGLCACSHGSSGGTAVVWGPREGCLEEVCCSENLHVCF